MTATFMRARRSCAARGAPGDPELAQRRQCEPPIEHGEAVALDLVEQRAIDRGHRKAGTLRVTVLRRKLAERTLVPFARTRRLERHQAGEVAAGLCLQQ